PSAPTLGPHIAIPEPYEPGAMDRISKRYAHNFSERIYLYTLAFAPTIIPIDGTQPIDDTDIGGIPAAHAGVVAILDDGTGSFLFFYNGNQWAYLTSVEGVEGWLVETIGMS